MASTAVTTRYPKRKRAEISYYDGSSDGVQVDGEYAALDESLEATTRKVCQNIMAVIIDRQDVI